MDVVKALIDGGKASAGPPLGPALGPYGVNVGAVISKINEATREFEGIKVPVEVIIDKNKSFEIKVGSPPTSALIKRKLKLEKGSSEPNKNFVGDLSLKDVMEIAKLKYDSMVSTTLKSAAKEVCGTCNSMGIKVEGMVASELIKKIDAGEYEEVISEYESGRGN